MVKKKNNMIHFEQLWEQCENLHKETKPDSQISGLVDELMMKISLYKAIDQKIDLAADERKKIKSRTLGEILLTITNISLQDDINVFDALNTAFKYHSIEIYSQKY